MHLAAHRKNSALAFNRLVDLTEYYARCRVSETDATVAALAKSDQSLSLEELEGLPHHDRVGLEAFRDCFFVDPQPAGIEDLADDEVFKILSANSCAVIFHGLLLNQGPMFVTGQLCATRDL
jgi:hypothetical protein